MTRLARWGVTTLCVAILVANTAGFAAAGASTANNESPLADAGLDQEVVVNETVFLDASASFDPDGTIEDYAWEIETPTGGTVQPMCPDCERTEFQVQQSGTYLATVTVTDDDGAERSDTVRIKVETVDPPEVAVSGPTAVQAGDEYDYTMTASAGDRSLTSVDWYVDGELYDRRSVDGDAASVTAAVVFTEAGEHTVTAVVHDVLGRTNSTTLSVSVSVPVASRPCPQAVWNETSGSWDTEACDDDGSGPDISNTDGDDSGDSDGVICSEYSTQGGPQGDRESCDDDRLWWTHDPGDPLELYDGNSDGRLTYAGLNHTAEELVEEYEGVSHITGTGVRFESVEAYMRATGGVPPNTDPDWWANVDPTLIQEKRDTQNDTNDDEAPPIVDDRDGGSNDGVENATPEKPDVPEQKVPDRYQDEI